MPSREAAMTSEILEQAADWLDQETELSPAQQVEFETWLQCPEHAAAYEKMQALLNSDELTEAMQQSQTPHNTVVPITRGKSAHMPWAIAASFVGICLISYLNFSVKQQPSAPTALAEAPAYKVELIAPIATRTSSLLKDGSHVHLNAESVLQITQTTKQRLASLSQGQVFFDVAADKQRPFVISAGNSEITVVGTAFDVDHTLDYTKVSVYEGIVEVSVSEKDHVRLTAGQSVRIQAGKIVSYTDQLQDMLPAWRTGWLEVENVAMHEVIGKLQRYLTKEVVIDSQTIQGVKINGRFALDKPEDALALISHTHHLELHHEAQRIILRTKG